MQVEYQGMSIDFAQPFRRATMTDLVKDATGVDFSAFGDTDLPAVCKAASAALEQGGASEAAVYAVTRTNSPSVCISIAHRFSCLAATLQGGLAHLGRPETSLHHWFSIIPCARAACVIVSDKTTTRSGTYPEDQRIL